MLIATAFTGTVALAVAVAQPTPDPAGGIADTQLSLDAPKTAAKTRRATAIRFEVFEAGAPSASITIPLWLARNASRLLPKPPPGANVKFVIEDVGQVHRQMLSMAGARNIWVVGGGNLAAQYLDRGLLDELIVQVTPVLLGQGKPLLPRRITRPMKRISVETYGPFTEIRYSLR